MLNRTYSLLTNNDFFSNSFKFILFIILIVIFSTYKKNIYDFLKSYFNNKEIKENKNRSFISTIKIKEKIKSGFRGGIFSSLIFGRKKRHSKKKKSKIILYTHQPPHLNEVNNIQSKDTELTVITNTDESINLEYDLNDNRDNENISLV